MLLEFVFLYIGILLGTSFMSITEIKYLKGGDFRTHRRWRPQLLLSIRK
jgi:hypothetical protein